MFSKSVFVLSLFFLIDPNVLLAAAGPVEPRARPIHIEGEEGKVYVRLPSSFDPKQDVVIEGYLLPLLHNEYERKQAPKFSNGFIRLVTTKEIVLNRVAGAVPQSADNVLKRTILLGATETFLTNWYFKGLSRAMKYMALLEQWYVTYGPPSQVVQIRVPVGTEVYIGNTGPQESVPVFKQRQPGKKQKPAKVFKQRVEGGGPQVLVPTQTGSGRIQLKLTDIVSQFPLKDDRVDEEHSKKTRVKEVLPMAGKENREKITRQ